MLRDESQHNRAGNKHNKMEAGFYRCILDHFGVLGLCTAALTLSFHICFIHLFTREKKMLSQTAFFETSCFRYLSQTCKMHTAHCLCITTCRYEHTMYNWQLTTLQMDCDAHIHELQQHNSWCFRIASTFRVRMAFLGSEILQCCNC